MPDELKQTLRPVSGIVFTTTEILPDFSSVQGTAVTLADGNDTTGASCQASDQGQKANGTYREEWTLGVAAVAPISFVRVIARTRRLDSTSGLDGGAKYQPSINGTERGSEHAPGTIADDVQDFVVDPADGLAWTNAKVNAQKWGMLLRAFIFTDVFDDSIAVQCVDFKVELWGPANVIANPAVVAGGAVGAVGSGILAAPAIAGGAVGVSSSGALPAPAAIGGRLGVTAEGMFKDR